jgi:hypothetical protein
MKNVSLVTKQMKYVIENKSNDHVCDKNTKLRTLKMTPSKSNLWSPSFYRYNFKCNFFFLEFWGVHNSTIQNRLVR